MKKFAALLLALTMVLGMATITASAEGSERVITIGTTWDLYWDSFDGSIEDNPYYSGTTADEMMFAKVKQIEDKWNVKFEYINLTYAGAKESINTSVLAGTPDVDVYMLDLALAAPAAANGYITDLRDVLGAPVEQEEEPAGVRYNAEEAERFELPGVELSDRFSYRITLQGAYPQFLYWLSMPFLSTVAPEVARFFARFDVIREPLRFPATARPSEGRVLRVPVLREGRRTGGFHLNTDQLGEGVAHLFGDCFQLGAGFGLMTVLIGGNRLGEVLLQLLQFLERQCLEIESSHWALVS